MIGTAHHPGHRLARRGFALVITLALMILLVVVAVGLLTLSSISLRQSAQAQNQAVAQANARLALQLAIGELQRTLGPDQRVSVPADSLTIAPLVVHADWKNATAVLKHTDDALLPANEAPEAKIQREFAGWLVSGDPATTSVLDSAAAAVPTSPGGLLLMKGKTSATDVRAAAVNVTAAQSQSRYAWWVEDVGTMASMGLSLADSPVTQGWRSACCSVYLHSKTRAETSYRSPSHRVPQQQQYITA